MPPERVLSAMETGSMITMANGRTAAERRAIAEFLTGKSLRNRALLRPAPRSHVHAAQRPRSMPGTGPALERLGTEHHQHALPGAAAAGLTAADVPKLKLKWAFAFPGDLQSYSQATIVGGRIFVGSWGGKVYSLNAATGCIHWYFDAGAGVRSAVSVGASPDMPAAPVTSPFFGDAAANVYALDAATGRRCGRRDVDDFPVGAHQRLAHALQRTHLCWRGVG